ncbi:SHOCT domain-containing protein [Streptomyces sioyaensis]|uniref:SHOCT domain-containing protein n=1 Tax=Streptomyces sioyaensis TaxID=67364 RepID=UPI001F334292|nr:SHOCT domain-containing protein [Streptomyces sioyaensis]MCF3176893.1 SHOCT domain-containing protein [Streptomyces sioyaensis]
MVRYEGAGGWVEIGAASLTVCRTDQRPRPLPARVLPFQALSGVELKEATRLRRGRLHLWFGGGVLVPVGSDEDPNTIGFTYGQREAFRGLHEHLWNVVRTNDAQDIDVAAAYEAANDPLVAWLADRERAQERAAEDRAARERAAEQQHIDRLARKVGPQAAAREDIMAAALASATGDRCWLTLKHLPGLLLGGEQVFVVAECFLGSDLGTVVLTNQRLMFVQDKFSGPELSALHLGEIRAVAGTEKVTQGGVLRVETLQGVVVEFGRLKGEDLARLDEALRLAVGSLGRNATAPSTAPSAAPAAPPAPSQDVLDQIAKLGELHAAGVLTTAEFEQKKRQLLDRM